MFRDAIVELFETELQERFSSRARGGLISVLNYVGGSSEAHERLKLAGAYIFIRREYATRIKASLSSAFEPLPLGDHEELEGSQ